MINETILGYVTTERARGVTDEAIRGALLAQGWKEEDVTASMASGAAAAAPVSTVPKQFSFGNLYEGRLMRWQYFISSIELTLLAVVIIVLLFALAALAGIDALMYLAFAIYVPLVFLSFSLTIRRIHDLNWSGWLCLLMFIPFVGTIFALVLLFMKGTVGPNTYGPEQADRNFKNTVLNL